MILLENIKDVSDIFRTSQFKKLSLVAEQNQSARRTDNIRWPAVGRREKDGRILQNLLWVVKPMEKWSFLCRKFYYFDSCFYLKTFSFQRIS